MEPGDPLAKYFEFSFLTEEAVRDEEARTVVNELDKLFTQELSHPVNAGNGLEHLYQRLNEHVAGNLSEPSSSEMSEPYQEIEPDGIKLVSRIVRLKSEPENPKYFVGSSIYLIGVMGEHQTSITSKNCPIGVIKTSAGAIEFFKIEKNDNLGKTIVSRVVEDPSGENIFAQEGSIDTRQTKATILSHDERYLVVAELSKALTSLE